MAAIRGEFLNIVVFGARARWPLNVIWRWPLFGGSLYRKTMGKHLGPSVSGRYLEVAAIRAIRGSTHSKFRSAPSKNDLKLIRTKFWVIFSTAHLALI